MSKYSIGLAGPDLNQMSREYGSVGTDDRFNLAMMLSNWRQLNDSLQDNDEPDLLILYADIAPGPDALRDFLSRLKRAVAVILLPPAWANLQGAIEKVHTVRKVYILPAAAEVLKFGFSAVETERAKAHSISPLQQVYAGGPRAAAAVGTRVIAFVSAQGGAGRSTLAEALGFELAARRNIRTLLFSFDLPSMAPLRNGVRYHPDAGEFFARPGANGFRDAIQSTPDGLDVILAPSDSYAYEKATRLDPESEAATLRSLVITSYTFNYGAILLDLPSGEGAWTLQPLLAANTVIIVARPTMDGVRAVAHTARLIAEQFMDQHRVPREAIFVVLNQRTNKSMFNPTAFTSEGSAFVKGWFPPVLATIDYDPAITQAQDGGRPAASASETLGKAAASLAGAFYGSGEGLPANPRGKGFTILGVTFRSGG